MAFVWIAPGTFHMGSPRGEEGRGPDESPQHQVEITRGFYLGKFEITQRQWRAVMGGNPSFYIGPNRPVEQASWSDVQIFIDKLNQAAGAALYRLPSEAEWEYAARANSQGRWTFDDD